MKRVRAIPFICVVGLLAAAIGLTGCDSTSTEAPAPKVVRKKIVVPGAKQQVPEKQQAAASKPATPKPPAPAVAKPTAPAPKSVAAKPAAPTPKPAGATSDKPSSSAPQPPSPETAAASQPKPSPATKAAPTPPQSKESEGAATRGPLLADLRGTQKPTSDLIKIDPFAPVVKEEPEPTRKQAAKRKRKRRRPQTPLERVDVGQLKLTAIIKTPGEWKALVEETSGKGYIVKKGTYIGIHSGQIIEIKDESIVVEEEIENAIGELMVNKRELKLLKPLGE